MNKKCNSEQRIFAAIEAEIESEISTGIINGGVISAGSTEETLFEQCWGYADIDSGTAMRMDTIIDMASVTKAIATSSALAICRDEGLIDFDQPFTNYLPQYKSGLEHKITVRDLAMHISAFRQQKYYDAATGQEIRNNLLSVPPPGQYGDFEYSCWNFHLLGMLIENVSAMSLQDFCQERIFKPLGMNSTSLGKPLSEDPARLARTCETEKAGQVSDFVAVKLYRDGFSAGNAGAFSCAPDLAAFGKCMLRGGISAAGKALFSDYSFGALTVPRMRDGKVQRSLGWIVADEFKPDGFSEHTIYHSGWSGQSLFMDLEKDFYCVILTTRTKPEYERARRGRFKIIGELADLL